MTIPKGTAKEREFYTVEEVEKLLILLENEDMKYRVFFNLAVYSGFRRSEMLGLEWKDIDFETGLVHIQRTSNYVAGMEMFEDTTKTKSSQRYIKLPPVMLDLLKEFKSEQDGEKAKLGSQWVETDRLFVKWNGEPMSSTTTYTWLKRFCERNNMRFCNIHSMRHHNNMKTYLLNLKHINTYLPVKQKLSNDVILHLTVFILIMEYIIYIVY